MKAELIGQIVMTTYKKQTFYRIVDVITDKRMDEVYVNEQYPSMKDYFEQKHQLEITKPKQPLLHVENKMKRKNTNGTQEAPTYLLPEFCLMTGIPDDFD